MVQSWPEEGKGTQAHLDQTGPAASQPRYSKPFQAYKNCVPQSISPPRKHTANLPHMQHPFKAFERSISACHPHIPASNPAFGIQLRPLSNQQLLAIPAFHQVVLPLLQQPPKTFEKSTTGCHPSIPPSSPAAPAASIQSPRAVHRSTCAHQPSQMVQRTGTDGSHYAPTPFAPEVCMDAWHVAGSQKG